MLFNEKSSASYISSRLVSNQLLLPSTEHCIRMQFKYKSLGLNIAKLSVTAKSIIAGDEKTVNQIQNLKNII